MKVIRMIVDIRKKTGDHFEIITATINAKGYKNREGRPWKRKSVSDIFHRWKDKL
jgi:hypothetical protein